MHNSIFTMYTFMQQIKPCSLKEGLVFFISCWVYQVEHWLPAFLAKVSLLQNHFHSFVLRPDWGGVTCLGVELAKQKGHVSSLQLVSALVALAVGTVRNVDTTQLFRMHDMLRFMFVCGMPWLFIMWKKWKACQSTSLMQVWLMTSAVN